MAGPICKFRLVKKHGPALRARGHTNLHELSAEAIADLIRRSGVTDFETFVSDAVGHEPKHRTELENDLVTLCVYGRSDEARKLWEAR